MHQHISLIKSASTIELMDPQVKRPRTPEPDDCFTYTFKSLFTLADLAAKRRANGGSKKHANRKDENNSVSGGTAGSAFLKRSKSSGDVAVFGDGSRFLNAAEGDETPIRLPKSLRSRANINPLSKIPKAKSAAWVQAPSQKRSSKVISQLSPITPGGDALNVDDAVFVFVTPTRSHNKSLTLAAHTPSLPRVASPFSPRTTASNLQQPRSHPTTARSHPCTGHTIASLHLTKSHWELRYESWSRSTHMLVPRTTVEGLEPAPTRSRFPAPLTNPALFPRAGSLTTAALRPVPDEKIMSGDARPAIEVDWAMRAWPLNKIQRALFLHDLTVRASFPIRARHVFATDARRKESEHATMRRTLEHVEGCESEHDQPHPLWEWDWEMRWRLVEGMAEDWSDRPQAERDTFLAEDTEGDLAYGGCDFQTALRAETADERVHKDVMEVDAIL